MHDFPPEDLAFLIKIGQIQATATPVAPAPTPAQKVEETPDVSISK
jgi:hypothetical protein